MSILSDYKSGTSKPIGELRRLVKELREVLEDEELSWATKSMLVFNTHRQQVNGLLWEIGKNLDYYDPDTSYEEDARAYVNALEDLVK